MSKILELEKEIDKAIKSFNDCVDNEVDPKTLNKAEAIFSRKLFKLEKMKRNKNFKHGENCTCNCGSSGTWDEMKQGKDKNEAEFDDAVFLNSHTKEVECYDCYLN